MAIIYGCGWSTQRTPNVLGESDVVGKVPDLNLGSY